MDKRASGEPFIMHPFEVATIVAKEIPLDDVTVAAALLHDVIEDTKFTYEDIKAEFGTAVADVVDGATKIEGMFENYETKQVENYRKMLLSMSNDIRVILVKFADRLHNMRTLEYLSPERQVRMARETLEIVCAACSQAWTITYKNRVRRPCIQVSRQAALQRSFEKSNVKKT